MLRDQIGLTLPPEPDANCADPVCSLKCRLPGGKIVSRRFLQTTTMSVLFDYLYTQGFSRDEFRFLTTYPKRDVCFSLYILYFKSTKLILKNSLKFQLASMPETAVMKGVFSPQDTLIVEER
jgi:hypothetical protein